MFGSKFIKCLNSSLNDGQEEFVTGNGDLQGCLLEFEGDPLWKYGSGVLARILAGNLAFAIKSKAVSLHIRHNDGSIGMKVNGKVIDLIAPPVPVLVDMARAIVKACGVEQDNPGNLKIGRGKKQVRLSVEYEIGPPPSLLLTGLNECWRRSDGNCL